MKIKSKNNIISRFNFITNLFLLFVLFFAGIIWADTNGIWHYAKDITPGIFGQDEADTSSSFIFQNPVSFTNNAIFNTNVTFNKNITISTILNCSGKLYTDNNGKILCGIDNAGSTLSSPPICTGNNALQWNGTNWICKTFIPQVTCTLDGVTKNEGQTNTFYNVISSTNCAANSLTRTCLNTGSFGGSNSYRYASCTTLVTCTLDGITKNEGQTNTFYSVTSSKNCIGNSLTRTCLNTGSFDGSSTYRYSSCTALAPTTMALNCADTSGGAQFYKNYGGRCGEQAGIDHWNQKITEMGSTAAYNQFKYDYDGLCGSLSKADCNRKFLCCKPGYTSGIDTCTNSYPYITNTNYCDIS